MQRLLDRSIAVLSQRASATAIVALFVMNVCQASPSAGEPLMLDGDCGEYDALGAPAEHLDPRTKLYSWQDAGSVWLCIALPDRSQGVLDLKLLAPALDVPINLHVSAQLGEWLVGDPQGAPASPSDDRWWNHRGWYANPLHFGGLQSGDHGTHVTFRFSSAREIQLSKDRFGRGEWLISLTLDAVGKADGSVGSISWPLDGNWRLHVD